MRIQELRSQISLGEDSKHQFKVDVRNADSLASEMAAFANCEGGTIYLGVADDGSAPGLGKNDIARINQLISNAASQLVKSPLTVRTENIALQNGRVVIVLTVPKGLDKPYFDKNGVIWLKTGADKRRVNSKEELRRLFQITDQFHADELPTKAGIDTLDKLRFRDFLRDVYKQDYLDDLEELMLVEKVALKVSIKGQPDLINDLLNTLRADPTADYLSLAHTLGVSEATVKRHIQKLKQQDRLRRVGSRKTGHWKVLE